MPSRIMGRDFIWQGFRRKISKNGGVELENIKERTIIFGGSLDIHAAPDQGATIRVSCPAEDKIKIQKETSPFSME